jgi:AcrR family transcriptional regulator
VTGGTRTTRAAAGTDRRLSLYSVSIPDQQPAEVRPVRTRDPARKQRILAAAADLFARNGFHSVSM